MFASRQADAEGQVDYVRDVKPIFKARCYACHGALKQESGLRLDAVALMLQGGESGAAIELGNADASYLLERVTDDDESSRMPQEGQPLTPEEIAKIASWIQQGATAPDDDRPEPDPREHWAFRRPVPAAAPTVSTDWVRNPIDAFIAAQRDERGLQPAGEADKPALLRRVYLDLIGLPPTREELHGFLADNSADAYEKVVDRLLASPQYGERWGRHWMDVWRYSDWYGRRKARDVMNSYAMIWRWRDWIVRSLNQDKPYDRMIVEMLAADEVAPENDENIVATGFLVRNFFKWNYNQWMKDNVEHTAKAFLGLTLNCAHCHDHKYDLLSQKEYFQFRAFFEPLELRHDRVPGSPDPGPFKKYVYLETYGPMAGGMIRVFDEKLDAQTFMYSRGDERNKIEGEGPVEPRVPAILGVEQEPIAPVALPQEAVYPGLKPFVAEEELARAQAAISQAEQKVTEAKTKLESTEPALTADVEAAQTGLSRLESGVDDEGPSQALTGKLSLFLDAIKGRRTLTNGISALGAARDGTTVSFQIMLLADGHANFQLALNTATAATAAFIGFEQGRIVTYSPGSYDVVEIGRYNLPSGQSHFQVTAVLDVAQDRLAISVKELRDNVALVENAQGALHGWNPEGRPEQGIVIDARPDTVAAFDAISLAQPAADPAVRFDFEEPVYAPGQDVVGREGWSALPFCVAPAVSVVSHRSTLAGSMAAARQQLTVAQRRLDAAQQAVPASETALLAAQTDLISLRARIAAATARYSAAADADSLAREASRAERTTAHAKAVAEEQAAEMSLAEVEAKPGVESEITAARARCDKAHQAVIAATEALVGEKNEFTLLTPTYPPHSTGRRTALAHAIAHRDNPLTARVAVNHIWMRHFGRPLVDSVFDFGRNGKPPSHPELLDWLAVKFMESGWQMKPLHRLMVTSSTYRMSSKATADSPNRTVDPDNRFLWRCPRRRMEAEAVRDSVLFAAGQLDLTLGGPEIEHDQAATTRRRSLYISHHGEEREPFLATFDAASPTECYRRTETVVPQQALAIANAELVVQASRAVARKLWQDVSTLAVEQDPETAFVDAVFEQLLTRLPHPQEREASIKLLKEQREVYRAAALADVTDTADVSRPAADSAMRARESLVHALVSHHDFVTVR